jgi:hypothetical protein
VISADTLMDVVIVGSLLTLVGNIGIFVVFWRRIAAEFSHARRKGAARRHGAGAKVLIDSGDGTLVPLDDASKTAVHAAMTALEQRLRA